MPVYEYECPDCQHTFEAFQKISDPRITVCPECQGSHVRKLISQTSFVLKGGGWYKDHYGIKSGSGAGSSSKSEGGSTSSSTSTTASTGASAPAAAAK